MIVWNEKQNQPNGVDGFNDLSIIIFEINNVSMENIFSIFDFSNVFASIRQKTPFHSLITLSPNCSLITELVSYLFSNLQLAVLDLYLTNFLPYIYNQPCSLCVDA